MEMVDIVDENLHVLSTVSKKEAHEKGLLHKTVIGEVINSKGEMMLIKPYSHKQDAGQFVSPIGGHVTAGETDEQAIRREAEEEVGLTDFQLSFKGKAIFNREVLGRKENHYFIVYELETDQLPQLGEDEAESYQYFTKEEIKKIYKENPDALGAAFHFILKTFYKELTA